MAIPVISPAINRTRQAISQTSQRAILRLVPEISSGKPITNKSLTLVSTFLMVLILLAMFVISSLSTQDAFTLAKLQRKAQTLSDERDAINREIAFKSSPNALAAAASKLGMEPNSQPRFLELTGGKNG